MRKIITIEYETGNASFQNSIEISEVIQESVKNYFDNGRQIIKDLNGNIVGRISEKEVIQDTETKYLNLDQFKFDNNGQSLYDLENSKDLIMKYETIGSEADIKTLVFKNQCIGFIENFSRDGNEKIFTGYSNIIKKTF